VTQAGAEALVQTLAPATRIAQELVLASTQHATDARLGIQFALVSSQQGAAGSAARLGQVFVMVSSTIEVVIGGPIKDQYYRRMRA